MSLINLWGGEKEWRTENIDHSQSNRYISDNINYFVWRPAYTVTPVRYVLELKLKSRCLSNGVVEACVCVLCPLLSSTDICTSIFWSIKNQEKKTMMDFNQAQSLSNFNISSRQSNTFWSLSVRLMNGKLYSNYTLAIQMAESKKHAHNHIWGQLSQKLKKQ